jgi:hypothetical protein
MTLEWTHLKKTRRINRESSTALESTGSTKTWETKEDKAKICRRENRRKGKDLERGEEVGKRRNKMQKLQISPMLLKERKETIFGLKTVRNISFLSIICNCTVKYLCLGYGSE